ncbi:hypothetical protein DCC85_09365 [Paenibacillus sp. CAA11]|uniref:serine/threonine-protein kinase n=1 Tax=Paenibacillus sp. CAA11 TaxID=1532905 RepID=UPI000D3A4279|nr:serine/threonine-protein kinase [Paenibacillus sp. CAA11]AWB44415.1 hypothetical protein DCC85_09365 [Paenibacillus sp. CAA11]
MAFQPNPGDEIIINGITYCIGTHPAAPGMAYAQVGRQGAVYQLVPKSGDLSSAMALKIFLPKFRIPSLVHQSEMMERYASVPGLRVCKREVLTPERNAELIAQYPDLLYAVVMPWIHGYTWMDVITTQQELKAEESLKLATALAGVGSAMEQRGAAHTDLSAPNIIFNGAESLVLELVDVEQLYSPRLDPPEFSLSGSPGYASYEHLRSAGNAWNPYADRFAGAVILAEMLCWCDREIREAAWGESYFDSNELQEQGSRYKLMLEKLEKLWGAQVAELFRRAWNSLDARNCPTFGEWLVVLKGLSAEGDKDQAEQLTDEPSSKISSRLVALPSTIESFEQPELPSNTAAYGKEAKAALLMERARQLEHAGRLDEALQIYREAHGQAVAGGSLAHELAAAIAELEEPTPEADPEEGGNPAASVVVPEIAASSEGKTRSARAEKRWFVRWPILAAAAVLLLGAAALLAVLNGEGIFGSKNSSSSKTAATQKIEEEQQIEANQKAAQAAAEAQAQAKANANAEAKARAEAEAKTKTEAEETKAKADEQQRALAAQKLKEEQQAKQKAELEEKYKRQVAYNNYLAWKKERDERLAKEKLAKEEAARKQALERELKEVERKRKEKALQKQRQEDVVLMIAYYNSAYNAQKTGSADTARSYAMQFLEVYDKDPKYYVKNAKVAKRVGHIYKLIQKSTYELPNV